MYAVKVIFMTSYGNYRGICELLEVMKVDMANFEVKQSRPVVEEHSATYEKNQFMKLLKADPSRRPLL